ncbi:MAG: endonuclease III [Ignavibacteriales bacterium CG_4_9_14_3_um_filter_30_11]|nr:MAG: endonuclease III [Ignavibacteriales bacterium CG_4_9_14_3_um_filter_30_11]
MKIEVNKRYVGKIFSLLKLEYPEVSCFLNHETPFQLLISTILSAQCTDERVNIVTEKLFKDYRTQEDFVKIPSSKLEKYIYSTGFFKQKAKSIKNCSKMLIEKYDGEVPNFMNELVKLPGVGRKTASVVLGNVFKIPSIAVDTHVTRLTNLLGIVDTIDPVKIEFKLKEYLPKNDWINSSHYLIIHGRNVCNAKKPKCSICILSKICPSFKLEI